MDGALGIPAKTLKCMLTTSCVHLYVMCNKDDMARKTA